MYLLYDTHFHRTEDVRSKYYSKRREYYLSLYVKNKLDLPDIPSSLSRVIQFASMNVRLVGKNREDFAREAGFLMADSDKVLYPPQGFLFRMEEGPYLPVYSASDAGGRAADLRTVASLPMSARNLVDYPDVVRWHSNPTIYLQYDAGRSVLLARGHEVVANDIKLDIPNMAIASFVAVPKWTLVKQRPDRLYASTIEEVEEVKLLAKRPITIGTMLANDTTVMDAYHDRIRDWLMRLRVGTGSTTVDLVNIIRSTETKESKQVDAVIALDADIVATAWSSQQMLARVAEEIKRRLNPEHGVVAVFTVDGDAVLAEKTRPAGDPPLYSMNVDVGTRTVAIQRFPKTEDIGRHEILSQIHTSAPVETAETVVAISTGVSRPLVMISDLAALLDLDIEWYWANGERAMSMREMNLSRLHGYGILSKKKTVLPVAELKPISEHYLLHQLDSLRSALESL
jgi:hypothetical protein